MVTKIFQKLKSKGLLILGKNIIEGEKSLYYNYKKTYFNLEIFYHIIFFFIFAS